MKYILPRKIGRILCVAAAVYGCGYFAARTTKLLVHYAAHDKYSVSGRYHLVLSSDRSRKEEQSGEFHHWYGEVVETIFRPAEYVESVAWRAIPRSYKKA